MISFIRFQGDLLYQTDFLTIPDFCSFNARQFQMLQVSTEPVDSFRLECWTHSRVELFNAELCRFLKLLFFFIFLFFFFFVQMFQIFC